MMAMDVTTIIRCSTDNAAAVVGNDAFFIIVVCNIIITVSFAWILRAAYAAVMLMDNITLHLSIIQLHETLQDDG